MSSTEDARARVVLTSADVGRVVDRLAHEILERTSGGRDVVLLGIPTRGVPLAHRLAERMATFGGLTVPVGALDVTLYRDDLRTQGIRALRATHVPGGNVDGRAVVLVDDVLSSGRTVGAALDALKEHGRPHAVRLAVLVDRGHRELPIRPDYVGKNLPTARDETVQVRLQETDGIDEVVVVTGGGL